MCTRYLEKSVWTYHRHVLATISHHPELQILLLQVCFLGASFVSLKNISAKNINWFMTLSLVEASFVFLLLLLKIIITSKISISASIMTYLYCSFVHTQSKIPLFTFQCNDISDVNSRVSACPLKCNVQHFISMPDFNMAFSTSSEVGIFWAWNVWIYIRSVVTYMLDK